MDTTVLLVLLTLRGNAPLGVNFVNFDDLAACQARAEQLEKILTKGGIKVVENRCLASFQHFTRHRHRASKGDHGKKVKVKKKNIFLIALGEKRALVMQRDDREKCEEEARKRNATGGGTRYYCAASEQEMKCEKAAGKKTPGK